MVIHITPKHGTQQDFGSHRADLPFHGLLFLRLAAFRCQPVGKVLHLGDNLKDSRTQHRVRAEFLLNHLGRGQLQQLGGLLIAHVPQPHTHVFITGAQLMIGA